MPDQSSVYFCSCEWSFFLKKLHDINQASEP
jgi:hypothetical protein